MVCIACSILPGFPLCIATVCDWVRVRLLFSCVLTGLLRAVVKGGRIVEQGTHKQLMAHTDGAYAALAKMQMGAPQSNSLAEKDVDIDTEEGKPTGTLDTALSAQHSLEKQVGSQPTVSQPVAYTLLQPP